jgi:site-specific DNA-methyltransferase (adenine-specific)
MLKKVTQGTTRDVFTFVPLQDFYQTWSDEKLYAKYKINKDEQTFIESMVRPMELSNNE